MPQVWMTYEEAGSLMDCSPEEARAAAIDLGWNRKRSRDGFSRLKLPSEMVDLFIETEVRRRLAELSRIASPVRELQDRVALLSAPIAAAA